MNDPKGTDPGKAAPSLDEQSFYKLLESTTDALVLHRKGAIVYANPSALAMFGYPSPEGVLGRSPLDFVSPGYRAVVADRVYQTYYRHALTSEIEERLLHKSGREIPVQAIAIPLSFEGEAATLVHIRDISARKELEVWLRAEDRLASVGMIASGISHEINNPLTYALCNAELLKARLEAMEPSKNRDECTEMLASVLDGLERAAHVTREVSLFSRAERDGAGPVDIHRVLDSCVNLASVQMRGRARVVKHYGEVPQVHGNAQQLGQVFLNLLVNAAQAIPPGDESRHEVSVTTLAQTPSSVVVEVRDTGTGVAPDIRALIFEPLFTTKAEGTGLGLSIARALVKEQGGTIAVESEPGHGTCFRVVLVRSEAPAAVPSPGKTPPVRSAGKHILIVDDEPRLGTILQLVLAAHETQVSPSGSAALGRLRAGETFDLILCDMLMGDLDGVAFYEAVKKEWPGTEARIVFMSGDVFAPRASGFFRSIPNRHLQKPFEPQELLEVVDGVLATLPARAP